jgi:uncharacterized repeat protein (TIGR01451 family)
MYQRLLFVFVLSLAFLSITTFFLRAGTVSGTITTYYVDPLNGSNTTGEGSQSNPWQTIAYALSQTPAGNTIRLLPGNYTTNSGEPFPIRLKAGVSLVGSGQSNTFISGVSDENVLEIFAETHDFASNTAIRDLTIQHGNNGIAMYAVNDYSVAPHIENVRIRGNRNGLHMDTGEVYKNGGMITAVISNSLIMTNQEDGIYMRAYGYFSPSHIAPKIVNSQIRENGSHGLHLNPSAVSANGSSVAPYILDSYIANNGIHGIHAIGIYSGWAKPQIERSRISNNSGIGIYWTMGINGGSFGGVLTNTIVSENQQGGIFLGLRNYYEYDDPSWLKLINSNVIDNKEFGIYWIRSADDEVIPDLRNSIIWNPDAKELYGQHIHGYELPWTAEYVQHSIVRDGSLDDSAGNLSLNPRFYDGYRLSSCSPAINAGTVDGAPDEDIEGRSRPVGAGIDIGVYESDLPCLLETVQEVSLAQPQWGDQIDYTLKLTNSMTITAMNLSLTNPLPPSLSFVPGSLWTSTADNPAIIADNEIRWSGTLTPTATITIAFQGQVNKGNTTIRNAAYIDAGPHGIYAPVTELDVPPLQVYLPALAHRYCSAPFYDDFSNLGSGWPIADNGSVIYRYLGGEYNIYHRHSNQWTAATRGDIWINDTQLVQIDGRVAANQGLWGLVFGINADWSSFYTFEMLPFEQRWVLLRFTNPDGWQMVSSAQTGVINPGHASNRLKMQTFNEVGLSGVRFWINHNPVATLYSDTDISGRVGITAGSFSPDVDVRFDNYYFVAQDCPLPPVTSASANNDSDDSLMMTRPYLNQWLLEQSAGNGE